MTTYYTKIGKKTGIEPIELMEKIVKRKHIPRQKALLIALAVKYLWRLGDKPGSNLELDLAKALNYLYRALCGKWLPENIKEEIARENKLPDIIIKK